MRPYSKAFRRKRNLLTNPYTTVNTGSSYMPPRVSDVFSYRARARPIDEALAKLFGLDSTPEIDNDPRVAAQQRRAVYVNAETMLPNLHALLTGWDANLLNNIYDHQVMLNGRVRKIFLFWNRSRTIFFFVEIVYFSSDPPLVRRSLGMSSRHQAQTLYDNNCVHWLEAERLSPPRD